MILSPFVFFPKCCYIHFFLPESCYQGNFSQFEKIKTNLILKIAFKRCENVLNGVNFKLSCFKLVIHIATNSSKGSEHYFSDHLLEFVDVGVIDSLGEVT